MCIRDREWVEEIVALCQQVLDGYAKKVGDNYIVLSKPSVS